MSPPNEPNSPDQRDLLSAFDQVVDREKDKAAQLRAPARKRRTSMAVIGLCLALWGFLGYTWLARPQWLFSTDQAPTRTPKEREATLRFGMYLEAERVRDFLDRQRRLPMQLSEAGDVEEGVAYEVTGNGAFVITGSLEGLQLKLSSGDDVQAFLAMTGMKPAPRGQ